MRNRYSALWLVFILLLPVAARAKDDTRSLIDRAKYCLNHKDPDSGLYYADKALTQAQAENDNGLQARAMTLKGKGLFYKKKSTEAIDLYFKALRLCKSPADDKQIAYIYGEIGYAYFNGGHAEQAREYYEKEIAIRRTANGRDSIGNQLMNLSVMYQQMGLYDSAGRKLDEIRDILTRNNNLQLRGYYNLNRGALMQVAGKLDSTERYYNQAYDVWRSLGNDEQLFRVTFNLGYLAYQRKDYAKAIKYYHLSEAAAKKFGSGREVAHLYGTMAESYAAAGDYKNAYGYLYQFATMSDSFSKEDFNSYALKLDKQFQTEKSKKTIQEQQIKLQSASLEVQKQKNKVLVFVLILVGVALGGVVLFGYLSFKGRVRKEVEQAKNTFFANVVHEIRTPLSMIQGPVKVLQSKVTDAGMLEQLAIAERNTNRLNELINQMLDLSKVDAGKLTISPQLGNLSSFLNELSISYKAQADQKQLKYVQEIALPERPAIFDRDAIEKVVSNLVGNAIKYTPARGSVGLEVRTLGINDEMLSIRVWDTGCGIPREEQDKVFDRFYRQKEHEAAGTKGIGIGLALVKDLVTLMRGTIELESDRDKGAVFTVQLPLQYHVAQVNVPVDEGGGSVVLLVEDDADILAFNKRLLSDHSYQVITAANGIEAEEVLKEQMPDLVITDLMMPGKDGIGLLKDIRSSSATEHIPVIILSAKASARLEGVQEGAQVFLAKPFLPEELIGLVHNQLDVLAKARMRYREMTVRQDKNIEQRFAGTDPFTQKCYSLVQEHLDDDQLTVEKLAELMNINRSHFQRKIKTLTGFSPSELIRTVRLEKARKMLQQRKGNIKEIAYSTGFSSQSYFSKCFTDHFGHPPSQEFAPERESTAA